MALNGFLEFFQKGKVGSGLHLRAHNVHTFLVFMSFFLHYSLLFPWLSHFFSHQWKKWDVVSKQFVAFLLQTFRPKKRFTQGTIRYSLHKQAQASLQSGINLRQVVKLPDGENLNDWIAVHGESVVLFLQFIQTQTYTLMPFRISCWFFQ